MAISEDTARKAIESFLERVRREIQQRSLSEARLPRWLVGARVRVGWVRDSLIAVFDDSGKGDTYALRGPVGADSVVLFDSPDFSPTAASLRAPRDVQGLVLLGGSGIGTTLNLIGDCPALFDCGYFGYHSPLALADLFIQHTPATPGAGPVAGRFVSFALYTYAADFATDAPVWNPGFEVLMDHFQGVHDSPRGDFYEQRYQEGHALASAVQNLKESSVIVLGSYAVPHLGELLQVRDYLTKRGYDANILEDMPEAPAMSLPDKVRTWTATARFCIMVDRVPSGHLIEYQICLAQQSILALLRPQASGSTYMLGDEQLASVNHIRVFEFRESPLTELDHAVNWADKLAAERAKAYGGEAYPWRNASAH